MHFPVEFFYPMWSCDDHIIKEVSGIDSTFKPKWSPSVFANEVAITMTQGHPTYAVLHIRRGDVVELCDSSPKNVGLHVNCWIGQFPAIFICSDEVNNDYITEVIQEVSKYSDNVKHVESESWRFFQERGVSRDDVDNFLIYEICNALKALTEYKYVSKFGGHGHDQKKSCERSTRCARNNNLL